MTYSPDTLEAKARLGLSMEEMDLCPAPTDNPLEPITSELD